MRAVFWLLGAAEVDLATDLAQVGDDVVLVVGDDSLTFLDQQLSDFSDSDFGL